MFSGEMDPICRLGKQTAGMLPIFIFMVSRKSGFQVDICLSLLLCLLQAFHYTGSGISTVNRSRTLTSVMLMQVDSHPVLLAHILLTDCQAYICEYNLCRWLFLFALLSCIRVAGSSLLSTVLYYKRLTLMEQRQQLAWALQDSDNTPTRFALSYSAHQHH